MKSKKKIRALIVEDEEKSLNNLKNQLKEHCPQIEVVGEARTIAEATAILKKPKFKIDVAFLDINLPDGSVFQLLDQLQKKQRVSFDIIFVTAYEEHSVKACNYSSIGFVVKPINHEELSEAVSRIQLGNNNQIDERLKYFEKYYKNPNAFEKMSISALDGIYFINIKEIVRCEAEDNYTHIHMENGEKLTASRTIKSYEELLRSVNFYRVHKSHLVNLNFMRKFVKGDGGYLVMDDGKKIEVSRRRRPAFMERLKMIQDGINMYQSNEVK